MFNVKHCHCVIYLFVKNVKMFKRIFLEMHNLKNSIKKNIKYVNNDR